MKLENFFFVVGLLIILTSCNKEKYPQYIENDNPHKVELELLFPLLEVDQKHHENRFTVMSEIISKMRNQEDLGKLNLLITTYINNNPKDPYNSYYILSLASNYLKKDLIDFAKVYLNKAIMEFQDLEIRGESTHLKALEILIGITNDNLNKVYYYKRLIKNHSENINESETYYKLGETLEVCELWDQAIESFEKYLSYPSTSELTEAEMRDDIINKVGFHYSNKRWVEKDLDTLVNQIKYAIEIRNPVLLDRYRAFNFFIINWKSKYTDLKSSFPMESYVLTNMNIKTALNLDPMSNETEAYLAVEGYPWTSSIWYVYPTWYFYFRQIDFPQDPEIHGGWEWAGIFLGEKL